MRFALQVGRASLGSMACHISGAYVGYLRRNRGWTGPVFHHYAAIPLDAELFLDDLVIWLHRPPRYTEAGQGRTSVCWTANSAYVSPTPSNWITTELALAALVLRSHRH